MIKLVDINKCSGCSACANICPFNCINMEEDHEGFRYPKVDKTKCKQCRLCQKVCPIINKQLNNHNPVQNTYACINNNEGERLSSSSGGVFSLLAKAILNQKGIVYGVAMTKDCYGAEFVRVGDIHQLYQLKGSKYLQAVVGDAYRRAKSDLDNGLLVLFSGTGCQINGLKNFLKIDYDNLYCIDVICHGVPSPALWRKYVQTYERKYGKLKHVNFRCKDNSWKDFGMKEDSLYISKDQDSFMQMFLNNYCLRPSCYQCVAKAIKMSDMTIADFWGIEKIAPEMDDGKGASLVLIRTKKGIRLFNLIVSGLTVKEVSYEDGVRGNPSEYKSVKRPVKRDTLFKDMNSLPFEELKCKYLHISLIMRMKKIIIQMIEKIRTKVHRGGVKLSGNSRYGIQYKFDSEINDKRSSSDR